MTNQQHLSDRQELFNEMLPDWEGAIRYLAFRLMQTRTLDRGLIEQVDLQNQLREAMWSAIETYDPKWETKLSTWINFKLKRECSLIVQDHYNKVPRDGEGNPIAILSLTPEFDPENEDNWALNIEDPHATDGIDLVDGMEWFKRNTELIYKVLKPDGAIDEVEAFTMMMSDEYASDKEIARVLNVNWAKVGEVRMKAKIVFSIMEGIPLESFTRDKNAVKVYRRIRHLLRSHIRKPVVDIYA